MRSRTKALVVGAVATAMTLGGAGTAYATHYQDKALPGSTLGGVAVSGMTRAELAAEVRDRVDAVTVELRTDQGTRSESLADLGYTVDVDATVDAVLAANGSWSSYATSLVSSRDHDAVVTEDPDAVDVVVAGLVEDADALGSDATVGLSKDKTYYAVTPAVVGQTVDPTSLQDVAAEAARTLTSATTAVEFVDSTPTVTTEDAQEVADAANALVRQPVTLSDGEEEYTASAGRKASWVTIPTADGTPGTPALDAAKVTAWVEEVAKAAKVSPTTGLRYVDSAGTVRRVVTEAVDGRQVSNTAAVSTALAKRVTAGKAYAGDFEYETSTASWDERTIAPGAENLAYPAAVGEKWIDVNLSRHTMTAYIGADVVYGPIAMVDGQAEKPTVTGTFQVYYKNPLMTMRGNNADGTTYETENVPWSSFFHRGFALHGAPWRSSFGYSASHGCVNLPVSVAKWVYDFAPVGTTVTSHY